MSTTCANVEESGADMLVREIQLMLKLGLKYQKSKCFPLAKQTANISYSQRT
jgi:hypothetical protein